MKHTPSTPPAASTLPLSPGQCELFRAILVHLDNADSYLQRIDGDDADSETYAEYAVGEIDSARKILHGFAGNSLPEAVRFNDALWTCLTGSAK